MKKKEDLQYLSTKVSPETYAVFGQMARDRNMSHRELLEVLVRAWLLGEVAAGHVADTPEAVAFVLRHSETKDV